MYSWEMATKVACKAYLENVQKESTKGRNGLYSEGMTLLEQVFMTGAHVGKYQSQIERAINNIEINKLEGSASKN